MRRRRQIVCARGFVFRIYYVKDDVFKRFDHTVINIIGHFIDNEKL